MLRRERNLYKPSSSSLEQQFPNRRQAKYTHVKIDGNRAYSFNRSNLLLFFLNLLRQDGEVMTARCKACWLKLALTGFQMRESDHDDLRKLLPTFMQDAIPLAVDRPTVVHWAPNRGQMIRMKSNSSSTPNVTFALLQNLFKSLLLQRMFCFVS